MLNVMGNSWIHHHDIDFSLLNRVNLPSLKIEPDGEKGKLVLNHPNYN